MELIISFPNLYYDEKRRAEETDRFFNRLMDVEDWRVKEEEFTAKEGHLDMHVTIDGNMMIAEADELSYKIV